MDADLLKHFNYHVSTQNFFPKKLKDFNVQMTLCSELQTEPKSKPSFEILEQKSFRWHLETWKNQVGSIFKFEIKKRCQIRKMVLHPAPSSLYSPPPPDNASCTPAPCQKKYFCTLPPQPMCIRVAPCCKRIVLSHFIQYLTLWRKGDFST